MVMYVDNKASSKHPLVLTAHLDPGLSRWKWLVKWFLAIPHYFLLAFLWPAFLVVTVVAGFGILFTGHYPRPLFDFTSGVLRWSWRVSYYAANGGLGTDQYPRSPSGTPLATRPAWISLTRQRFPVVWCWSSGGCWPSRTT